MGRSNSVFDLLDQEEGDEGGSGTQKKRCGRALSQKERVLEQKKLSFEGKVHLQIGELLIGRFLRRAIKSILCRGRHESEPEYNVQLEGLPVE